MPSLDKETREEGHHPDSIDEVNGPVTFDPRQRYSNTEGKENRHVPLEIRKGVVSEQEPGIQRVLQPEKTEHQPEEDITSCVRLEFGFKRSDHLKSPYSEYETAGSVPARIQLAVRTKYVVLLILAYFLAHAVIIEHSAYSVYIVLGIAEGKNL